VQEIPSNVVEIPAGTRPVDGNGNVTAAMIASLARIPLRELERPVREKRQVDRGPGRAHRPRRAPAIAVPTPLGLAVRVRFGAMFVVSIAHVPPPRRVMSGIRRSIAQESMEANGW